MQINFHNLCNFLWKDIKKKGCLLCNEPRKFLSNFRGSLQNGLLLHSDQGWHYQHIHYQHMLKQRGIVQSMSRKGNCLDNSVMENFFGLMKNELLYVNHFDSMDDFKRQLADYIDYYNNKRIKLKLKMSPVQYRTHFCRQIN